MKDKKQQQQQQHSRHNPLVEEGDGQLPPADMPTDAWVKTEQDQEQEDNFVEPSSDEDVGSDLPVSIAHSFLAPVADLLNFGPPCTRGKYNEELHTFDIVASCNFRKGQEVTFWYSDECDHVLIGVYGFTHPIVPPCPTVEDYRRSSQEWQQQALLYQEQLQFLQNEFDAIEWEHRRLTEIFNACGKESCCRKIIEGYMKAQEQQQKRRQVPLASESGSSGSGGGADNGDSKDHGNARGHEHVRGGFFLASHGTHVRKNRRDQDNTEF
jgi:hypothetical protein